MQPVNQPPMMKNSFEVGADDTFPQIDFSQLGKDENGNPIEFPDLEFYGFDHGDKTAKLAVVILGHEYSPQIYTPANRNALWVAGYFHDIGRTEPWQKEDYAHGLRSAQLLERILKSSPVFWADGLLRETACRLVANHSNKPNGDPLACALWDADCFESARIRPGTYEGLQRLKERTAFDNLTTRWARNRDQLRIYMNFRGW